MMEEKILNNKKNGMAMLFLFVILYVLAIASIVLGGFMINAHQSPIPLIIGIIYTALGWIPLCGLKVIKPQEALVLTLFGTYVGTLKDAGFYFVNPFCSEFNPAETERRRERKEPARHTYHWHRQQRFSDGIHQQKDFSQSDDPKQQPPENQRLSGKSRGDRHCRNVEGSRYRKGSLQCG